MYKLNLFQPSVDTVRLWTKDGTSEFSCVSNWASCVSSWTRFSISCWCTHTHTEERETSLDLWWLWAQIYRTLSTKIHSYIATTPNVLRGYKQIQSCGKLNPDPKSNNQEESDRGIYNRKRQKHCRKKIVWNNHEIYNWGKFADS